MVPKDIIPGGFLDRSLLSKVAVEQLQSAAQDSANAANTILNKLDFPPVPLPQINKNSALSFLLFLEEHAAQAIEASSKALSIATAKDPAALSSLRIELMKVLGGENPGWRNRQLKTVSIFASDNHFQQHYKPTLEQLHQLGLTTEKRIADTEFSRKKALSNQTTIARSYATSAQKARDAAGRAQGHRSELDSALTHLTQQLSRPLDLIHDTTTDKLVSNANSLSTKESNARIEEAKAATRAGISIGAILPAIGSSQTITAAERGYFLLEEMVNTAFLFGIACYEQDIAWIIQATCQRYQELFGDFIKQAQTNRKLLGEKVTTMKDTLKDIPTSR